MDDAPDSTLHTRSRFAAGLALAALAGASLALLAGPRVLPQSTPFYEARAGTVSARGADAEALRSEVRNAFAVRTAAIEATRAARLRLRAERAAAVPSGPMPALSPASACAALLRGWASAMRSLALASPSAPLERGGTHPAALAARQASIEHAAQTGDESALADGFALEQNAWREWLADEAQGLPADQRAGLWGTWRARIETRAGDLENLAALAETRVTPFQRQIIPLHAQLHSIALEPAIPDPSGVLATWPATPGPVVVRARAAAWLPLGAAGAVAAALLALPLLVGRGRRARTAIPAALPEGAGERAWLQVVSGPGRDDVTRGVLELAARALARGERVALLDLGSRLELHRPLGLSPRLGWRDCARERLPALGVIQNGGFTGLFLLAQGGGPVARDWLPLDLVLEELRPHFTRVVLAVESDAPALVGSLLAGRVMEGWWAGGGANRSRTARSASGRLAISLQDLWLEELHEPSLEALEARLAALTPAAAPARKEAGTPLLATLAPEVSAPAVLDCDLQLRQRLRFLAWMRRVQTERRSRDPESASQV